MRKLIFATVLSALGFTVMAQNEIVEPIMDEITVVSLEQDFEEISVSDLPEAVTAAVTKDYPSATIDKAYQGGSDLFKLEVSMEDGTSGTLYADAEGNWVKM